MSSNHASHILQTVLNHLVLPPCLPGHQDTRPEDVALNINERMINAVKQMISLSDGQYASQWNCLRTSLQTSKMVNIGGKLQRSSLLTALRELQAKGFLIIYVAEQNAALIVRRDHEERHCQVLIEAFESSPLSAAVLSSETSLLWEFPGCAVSMNVLDFNDDSFQNELSIFLEKASSESIKLFTARTHKAGSNAFESRDTVDPSLITQMLMTLLEANGSRQFPSILQKRVRDDVSWNHAQDPWRRAPFWLILRVAVQRHLYSVFGAEFGRVHYKFIICLVLTSLLDEALLLLDPEIVVHVKAKICRRLAKLESEKDEAAASVKTCYEYMFKILAPTFLKSTSDASKTIQKTWECFKTSINRPILLLPKRAHPRHLVMTLPNSENYLQEVLTAPLNSQNEAPASSVCRIPQDYDDSSSTAKPSVTFARQYFMLSEMEIDLESRFSRTRSQEPSDDLCLAVSTSIEKYLDMALDAYNSSPEQKSIMLLTTLDLWVIMDDIACRLFPLLCEFESGLQPNLLDVLQVARYQDMIRLKEIRSYLQKRAENCKHTHDTIFDDPKPGCFAERFFDSSSETPRLQKLYERILKTDDDRKSEKNHELEQMKADFQKMKKDIAQLTCVYTIDEFQNQTHDDHRCRKCYLQRCARRFKIRAHEKSLPRTSFEAKAVVFELACPKAFVAYRDVTWQIIADLGMVARSPQREAQLLLQDYSELREFSGSMKSRLSLASTKKSFLMTHYADVPLPADLADVFLPNGLKLKYFDTHSRTWTGKLSLKEISYSQHCNINLPSNSPLAFLQSPARLVDIKSESSSYEVIANQTKCPHELNLHEYVALQALAQGKNCRWIQILTELAAPNINFSNEGVTQLLNLLALQIGPANKNDSLGIIHGIFRDESFCQRLMEQVSLRLDDISSNYREINCMETIITFVLRVVTLGESAFLAASNLLAKARITTFKWFMNLRFEIQNACDPEISDRCSRYAFTSALLCRRTFALYAENLQLMDPLALKYFIQCSIAIQDNLVSDPATLDDILKSAFIRDLKMVYRMRFTIRRSIEASPISIVSVIKTIWPDSADGPIRTFSGLSFFDCANEWWVKIDIEATEQSKKQPIHFHLLQGHLLVMGKPVGKLPAEHRSSLILNQLFGDQILFTYPSAIPGMTYMLAITIHEHQIHIGFRNNVLVVRALVGNTIMELIPRTAFGDSRCFDLPATLIEKCVHWLDLKTGILEIRQPSSIWKSKISHWRLNIYTRQCTRRKVMLIDPRSPLFSRVARIFQRFEPSHHLTVFQPEYNPLSVELRRLELSFFVNGRNLLESPQLQAEITLDQDAGTWYGLNSKILLKETIKMRDPMTNRFQYSEPGRQKSIIVPLGDLSYRRFGPHVTIDVSNNGDYAKYTINHVLNRLDCPAEPRLLYLKAQLHAYTSFVLPDELTGRTGTEEALHCLNSASCQPWTPLTISPRASLESIARLTPVREYYPEGLKSMYKSNWDPNLTITIQHDGYNRISEAICAKSDNLAIFSQQAELCPPHKVEGNVYLTRRSELARGKYQRSNVSTDKTQIPVPKKYDARDGWATGRLRSHVMECVYLIHKWPSTMRTASSLCGIMDRSASICGYNSTFDRILLTDLLNLDIATDWGPLVNFCRSATRSDKYKLMFLFATASFHENANMEALKTLLAFAMWQELKDIELPNWPVYENFRQDEVPTLSSLTDLMEHSLVPYPDDDRKELGSVIAAKLRRKLEGLEKAHISQQKKDSAAFAGFLLRQWPCQTISTEGFSGTDLINVTEATNMIQPHWERSFQNFGFLEHLHQVQLILDQKKSLDNDFKQAHELIQSQNQFTSKSYWQSSRLIEDLLRKDVLHDALKAPEKKFLVEKELSRSIYSMSGLQKRHGDLVVPKLAELHQLVGSIAISDSVIQQQYADDLKHSLNALRLSKSFSSRRKQSVDSLQFSALFFTAEQETRKIFQRLCQYLEQDESSLKWLHLGNLWPEITPVTLLESLRSTSTVIFGRGMKEALCTYALSITNLQRLTRLQDAQKKSQTQKILDEECNEGHENWDPKAHTDWLLLEIDSNMLIRPTQVDVAMATISPTSRSNSVLQLNMGEGKTSCIMPMAVLSLADGNSLLRVVVPKPLLLQTAQLLQTRLGGLLGREVNHVPFSRKTSTSFETISLFEAIHKNIQQTRGLMLALPEHLLSFKLSGMQRLSDDRMEEANMMIQTQDWLTRCSRDILDECDTILAIKTQLIYPSGTQKTIDGHPHRWELVEDVLRRVEIHVWDLQTRYPQSIEVIRRAPHGFPVIFFLRKDVEIDLVLRLTDDACRGRAFITPSDCSKADRLAIKQFISEAKVSAETIRSIERLYPNKPSFKQSIYLLRGLFVHRILLMTLKKRWNVQYGLHPARDPIAVPFLAKGTPSDQAEWGHPDVAILLTCLAFYYDGLNLTQLRQCLDHILKSDDPSQVYDQLTQDSNVTESLSHWNAINMDDEFQMKDLWKCVQYSISACNYFLNNFVFPRHAKQFKIKLQASGWDLPLFDTSKPSSKDALALTTGFSGTNDWKRMLPLTIQQRDLPRLSHTNAEVLTYLLQDRNQRYVLAATNGRRMSEIELLTEISDRKIRVLIDAGAQILEMTNIAFAKSWLEIFFEAPAAVFFDQKNRPMVLYRQGHQIPLLASPYAENLSDCLVYLDQAHTRGTDLKFPPEACGALTLGIDQTKDHTVQAAMRLRQLGTTQSVVFFAPPEVHQSILDLRRYPSSHKLNSHDVVYWLLIQTCREIEQLQPLFVAQGEDFCRRAQAAYDNPNFLAPGFIHHRERYIESLRQVEQQTLAQLYGLGKRSRPSSLTQGLAPIISNFVQNLNNRRKTFQDTGNAVHASALQEVEQEREMVYEVEAVREVQNPTVYEAFQFPGLARDIKTFALSGRLPADSPSFVEAFLALKKGTEVGRRNRIADDVTSGRLFVTEEFTKAIKFLTIRSHDQFQRQVNWIIWSIVSNVALIVIPEEAEKLLPIIRGNSSSPTHLITYAAPVTRKMLHFSDLKFYAVPSLPTDWEAPMWLRVELGIFAGRLYFEHYEYAAMRNYLNITENEVWNNENRTESLTIVTKPKNAERGNPCLMRRAKTSLAPNPQNFLQEWLAIRRRGQDFTHTPMGFFCQDKPLLACHPFFSKSEDESARPVHVQSTASYGGTDNEDGMEEDYFRGEDAGYGEDVEVDESDDFDDNDIKDEDSEENRYRDQPDTALKGTNIM